MKRLLLSLPVVAALVSGAAHAEDKKLRLGVFLPTTVGDGQKRFELSEKLASELEKATGQKVQSKNFGRYQDFQQAKGQLDVAVVDAFAAAHLKQMDNAVATGVVDGEASQRWVVIAKSKGTVGALGGKRIAVPRGAPNLDKAFVTNVIFEGDLEMKDLKLETVPNVESALKLLESKGAQAAIVPASQAPKDSKILYHAGKLPSVVVLDFSGKHEDVKKAFTSLPPVGPLEKFTEPRGRELAELQQQLLVGPPKKLPVLSESPALTPEAAALVNVKELKLTVPTFLEYVEAGNENPDD